MRVRYSTKHIINHRKFLAFLAILVFLVAQLSVFRFVHAVQHNFGYDSGTGSAQYTIGTGSGTTDKITGSVFTITEDGTADSITVSLKRYSSNGNEKGKCSIYLHSGLSLVGNTTEATKALTTTLAWYTFTFPDPKPSLVANTAYVLVVWVDTTTYIYLGANSGDADQGHYQTVTYDGFPNPYVPTHVTYAFSIYCTYTVGGADVTNPTHSNVGTNTTQSGQPCLFYTLWNDNVNVSGYIFGTNNTGSWVNDTWAAFSVFYNTTAAWSNVTKTLTSTLGATVQWQIWANDTSNKWDATGVQSLVAVNTFVQTRYFRTDIATVNGLSARKLFITNTNAGGSETHSKHGNVVSAGATIGIRVWNRTSLGVETEITSGVPVAEAFWNTSTYGTMVNATWTCPSIPLASTDSIIVIAYGKYGTDAYVQFGSYNWSTEQLGASSLDVATWTVYYCIELWYGSAFTWHAFDFGSNFWNSRIENFAFTTPAVPKVWYDVSTWTASLATKTWSSGVSWTENLRSRIWNWIPRVDAPVANTTIDSMTVGNTSGNGAAVFGYGLAYKAGQTLRNAKGYDVNLTTLSFRMKRIGYPTNMTFQTIVYGCNTTVPSLTGIPNSTALAYSEIINATLISTDLTWFWQDFNFNNTNQVSIKNGQSISISVELSGSGDTGNYVGILFSSNWTFPPVTPIPTAQPNYSHEGNEFYYQTYWHPYFENDLYFIANGTYLVPETTFDVIARQYISVASWLFDFGTRIWVDAATWTYNWVTMAWQNITWIFSLGTSIWTDIATWGANLVTMMWNDVATYGFNLLAMAWHDLTWLFTLLPALPEWVNVAVWIFHLAPAEWIFPFIWIIMLGFIGLCCLVLYAKAQKKRETENV